MLGDFMEASIEQVAAILEATDYWKKNGCARRPELWVALPDEFVVSCGIAQALQLRAAQRDFAGQRGIFERDKNKRRPIIHRYILIALCDLVEHGCYP